MTCCVPFCKSDKKHPECKKGMSFHEFPSNVELREKWISNISRKDASDELWQPTDYSVVCSLHFTLECYKQASKRKILLPGSIPSIFPSCPSDYESKPVKKKKKQVTEESLPRRSKRSRAEPAELEMPVEQNENQCNKLLLLCNAALFGSCPTDY